MKTKAKSDEENDQYDEEVEGRLEDILEHENVDPEEGDVLEVGEEVEPGDRHQEGAHWPLPALEERFVKILQRKV